MLDSRNDALGALKTQEQVLVAADCNKDILAGQDNFGPILAFRRMPDPDTECKSC